MNLFLYGMLSALGFLVLSIWLFVILDVWLSLSWSSKVYGTTFFLGLASWTVAAAAFAIGILRM